jgi:hypothetical protein
MLTIRIWFTLLILHILKIIVSIYIMVILFILLFFTPFMTKEELFEIFKKLNREQKNIN